MAYSFGAPKIVTNGLVLYLDAANRRSYPGSGTAWNDLSGNGNHGTLTNGPTFSGDNAGSIAFDGGNDYVNCGNSSSLNFSTEMTLSYWTKSTFNSSYSILVDKRPNYSFWVDGSKSLDYYTTAPTITAASNVSQIIPDKWFNVTATISNSTLTWFINHEAQYTIAASLGAVTSNPLYIGTVQGFPVFGRGSISQIKIYNRALSAEEVLQNYNATKARYNL